jgi:penicillin-binding protein 1A
MTSARDVVALAKRMGIKSNLVPAPSLALGTSDVSPLEITSAFSVFANNGIRAVPYYILRVEDRNGKVLYRSKPEFEYVFDQKVAQMMTTCLQGVVNGGTASSIRNWFSYPAAGKTGTTQSYADAWFVGYTPHYAAGVWVGFDDKRVTFTSANGQGGRAAAPIWGRFMKYAYQAIKPKFANFNTDYSGVPGVQPDSLHKDSLAQHSVNPGIPASPNENRSPAQDAPPPAEKENKDGH